MIWNVHLKKKKKKDALSINNLSGPSNIEFHCVLGMTALDSRAPGKFAKSLQKTHRQRNYSAEQCFIKSCQAAVCRHRRETRGPRRKRPSETKEGGGVAPLTLFTTKNKEIEPRARWRLCRYCRSRQICLTHKLSFFLTCGSEREKRLPLTQNVPTMFDPQLDVSNGNA